MWMLIGFALHHVYSAVLMSQVEANATVESIFSGYKFVPREDLVYSGYRFVDRKDTPWIADRSLLILGLGNLLCSDDGVGARGRAAIAGTRGSPDGRAGARRRHARPRRSCPYLEDAERAILVDAIQVDAPPGTLVRLDGDEVGPAVAARLRVHQVGVADLIEAARWRGRIPPTLVLLGVVPETTELGRGAVAARPGGPAGSAGVRSARRPAASASLCAPKVAS